MGSRKIRQTLLYPLTDLGKIQQRQFNVEQFYNEPYVLKAVQERLSDVLDIERLSSRIAMDRAHAKDLKALQNSLSCWLKVRNEMSTFEFDFCSEEPAAPCFCEPYLFVPKTKI